MFKVGDKVKFVGKAYHPDYQNLGIGVVVEVKEHRRYPLLVVFTGYNYTNVVCPPYHPCDFEEVEKVE